MHTSLKNFTAILFIIAALLFSISQLQTLIHTYQTKEAKDQIIKALALECQEIKIHYKIEDTFENTNKVLSQMLGPSLSTFDEETYLAIMSFCYGKKETPLKSKI